MMIVLRLALIAAVGLVGFSSASLAVAATPHPLPSRPTGFIENRGQWPERTRFVSRTPHAMVAVEDGAIVLHKRPAGDRPGATVRLALVDGLGGEWDVRGLSPRTTRYHFLVGDDRSRWARDAASYGQLVFQGSDDGPSVTLRTAEDQLEIEASVPPGASASNLAFRCEGADNMRVEADGTLVIETAAGTLRHRTPQAWQGSGFSGERAPVDLRYEVASDSFRLVADGRDPSQRLTVGSGLDWSTFLGGSGRDQASSVARTADGRILVAGQAASLDFPTTPGVYQPDHSGGQTSHPYKAFITCLSADGASILWSTYLGGSTANESRIRIALDSEGMIHVLGFTGSSDFPVTPGAWDTTFEFISIFVAKLSSDGSQLVQSTFLGSAFANPRAIAVTPAGEVIVLGLNGGSAHPITPGAFEPNWFPNGDAFVTKLTADGTDLIFSTFLGDGRDLAADLVIAPDGSLVMSGWGKPEDAPSSAPFDGFVAVLSEDGSSLSSETITTSNGSQIESVAVAPNGDIVFLGSTNGGDLPVTPGVVMPINPTVTGYDSFVGSLSGSLDELNFLTYVSGVFLAGWSRAAIDVDTSGVITVGGFTNFVNYPVTDGAFQLSNFGTSAYYLTRLSPDGSRYDYSTYLGSMQNFTTMRLDLDVDETGATVFVAGTFDGDYPTTPGALDGQLDGDLDAVVTKLSMLPQGVERFGASTPGCRGPLPLGVFGMPRAGTSDFGIYCSAVPRSAGVGFLLVSEQALSSPWRVDGVDLWIDPQHLALALPVGIAPMGDGFSQLPVRVPDSPGVTVAVQYVWHDPSLPGYVASNALLIEIQD